MSTGGNVHRWIVPDIRRNVAAEDDEPGCALRAARRRARGHRRAL